MKQFFYILLIFLIPSLVFAQSIPKLNSVVVDNGDMLSPEIERQIEQYIIAIERETTAEFAVLTVESFEGMAKEAYAAAVFEKNKFGKEDKDNGLLLLISKNDKKYRVEVGYGLEGYITDAKKVDVGVKIIEFHFKQGNFDQGTLDAVKAMGGLVAGEVDILSKYGSNAVGTTTESFWISLMMGIIAVLFMLSIFGKPGFFFFPVPIGGRRQGGLYGGSLGGGSFGGGGFGGGSFGGGGFGGGW